VSTEWRESIMVAVEAGDHREVAPMLSWDGRQFEVELALTLRIGDTVTVRIRLGGHRRLSFTERARVELRLAAERGQRFKMSVLDFDAQRAADLTQVARDRMVYTGVARPAPTSAADEEPIVGRLGPAMRCLLVAFDRPEATVEFVRAVLNGAVAVETQEVVAVNGALLLRVELGDARPLYVRGRVVYHGEIRPGVPGMGVSVEAIPEAVRRALARAT
jgi:hypothetical protein